MKIGEGLGPGRMKFGPEWDGAEITIMRHTPSGKEFIRHPDTDEMIPMRKIKWGDGVGGDSADSTGVAGETAGTSAGTGGVGTGGAVGGDTGGDVGIGPGDPSLAGPGPNDPGISPNPADSSISDVVRGMAEPDTTGTPIGAVGQVSPPDTVASAIAGMVNDPNDPGSKAAAANLGIGVSPIGGSGRSSIGATRFGGDAPGFNVGAMMSGMLTGSGDPVTDAMAAIMGAIGPPGMGAAISGLGAEAAAAGVNAPGASVTGGDPGTQSPGDFPGDFPLPSGGMTAGMPGAGVSGSQPTVPGASPTPNPVDSSRELPRFIGRIRRSPGLRLFA